MSDVFRVSPAVLTHDELLRISALQLAILFMDVSGYNMETEVVLATATKFGKFLIEASARRGEEASVPVLLRYEAQNVIQWFSEEGHDGKCPIPCVPCQAVTHLRLALRTDR